MKKTFNLTAPNKKTDRIVDSIKHEVKKYLARERRKKLTENSDFWDFDCKIGENEEEALVIETNAINSKISAIAQKGAESFYLEILARPGFKKKRK